MTDRKPFLHITQCGHYYVTHSNTSQGAYDVCDWPTGRVRAGRDSFQQTCDVADTMSRKDREAREERDKQETTCDTCQLVTTQGRMRYGCPRCRMVLRLLFGDQRTDDKTGPEIKAFAFAEFERNGHHSRIESWLEGHTVVEVVDAVEGELRIVALKD